MPYRDITGQRFGRLTAVRYVTGSKWFCECDCGGTKTVGTGVLNAGLTKSCGCIAREIQYARTNHGGASTPTYKCWKRMISRCYDEGNASFAAYGGRGISVCDRWRDSFITFLSDMGELPTKDHSIDRINNNAGYSPENCRWATRSQQARNRRPKSKSGIAGVCKVKGRWQASAYINGKRTHLGYFDSLLDATFARLSAVRDHY